MSKVTVNKTKFLEYLKKGVSTALVLTTLASFAGCQNDKQESEVETTKIVETLPENENATTEEIYDFEFIQYDDEPTTFTEVYDWSDTESIIRAKRNDFSLLIGPAATNEESTITENKYSVIVCDNEKFGYTYYRIIDNEGNYYNDVKYGTCVDPTANSFVLSSYSDDEKYTILNRITGEEKNIEASFILAIGKYLKKCNEEEQDDYYNTTYELLYANGNPATNEVYDHINYDHDTQYLYLAKDGKTEIVDTVTNKAKKIDGEVTDCKNGFIVIQKEIDDKDYAGVFKLQDINSELEELIPIKDYWYISIISFDKENPIFECRESLYANVSDAKSVLLTKTGEPFISKKHDYYIKDYSGENTITGFDIYHFGDNKPLSFFDVYDADGNQMVANQSCNDIQFIPGTTLAKIQLNKDDKYGIVNCENGKMNYLIDPKYDKIIIKPIYDTTRKELLLSLIHI